MDSLYSGDFEEIYGIGGEDSGEPQAGLFDAILTCFFIDTVCTIARLWTSQMAHSTVDSFRQKTSLITFGSFMPSSHQEESGSI